MAKEILKDEKLSEEQLDQVAGGSTQQTEDILSTIVNYNPKLAEEISKNFAGFMDKEGYNYDVSLSFAVGDALKNNYNLDVTCYNASENEYSYNGKKITHQEVLNKIKATGDFEVI